MAFAMKTKTISPYSDPATVVRRGMPIISFPCPGCRRRCDFHMTRKADVAYYIECPDCGTIRVIPSLEGDKVVMTVGATGERYDDQAELNAAKARLRAVEGNAPEECLAMAEVAWETYLFLAPDAVPLWKGAELMFCRCPGIGKAHARRMAPWALRFCDVGDAREMQAIDRSVCAKAICAIGTPETAEDCMLWMDYFYLECRTDMLDRHEVFIPKIAKDAYLALPESEKARCPAFLTMWALIMYSCSYDYWEEGGIECRESELDAFESEMWAEAVSEAEKMLSAGYPMTPRIFRMFSSKAGHEALPPVINPVCDQLRKLGGMSGKYRDAFEAKADLLDVLRAVRGSPIMPFDQREKMDWTPEALGKLESVIRRLEKYSDPAIVSDVLIDAYYLLYTYNGFSETMDYCRQLEEEACGRLLRTGTGQSMNDLLLSLLGGDEHRSGTEPASRKRA